VIPTVTFLSWFLTSHLEVYTAYIVWHSILAFILLWRSVLALYLASILISHLASFPFFLTFYLTSILTFFLASILAFYIWHSIKAFYLAFYIWHSIKAFCLAFYSDILFWHSIWHSFCGILSGIYSHVLSDTGTEIWSSQLRPLSAHWDLEFAVGRKERRDGRRKYITLIESRNWQVGKNALPHPDQERTLSPWNPVAMRWTYPFKACGGAI